MLKKTFIATATAGMGTRLIRAMVAQLQGSYAYSNGQGASFSADIVLLPRTGATPTSGRTMRGWTRAASSACSGRSS